MSAALDKFFAPCPRGLEVVLTEELLGLGASNTISVDGGVHFSGTLSSAYRANLESRIASRVLFVVVGQFSHPSIVPKSHTIAI